MHAGTSLERLDAIINVTLQCLHTSGGVKRNRWQLHLGGLRERLRGAMSARRALVVAQHVVVVRQEQRRVDAIFAIALGGLRHQLLQDLAGMFGLAPLPQGSGECIAQTGGLPLVVDDLEDAIKSCDRRRPQLHVPQRRHKPHAERERVPLRRLKQQLEYEVAGERLQSLERVVLTDKGHAAAMGASQELKGDLRAQAPEPFGASLVGCVAGGRQLLTEPSQPDARGLEYGDDRVGHQFFGSVVRDEPLLRSRANLLDLVLIGYWLLARH